jgi:hypothetical protein
MGTHLHHIIPKHMGGTDDPSNLIELTIEEHAEAHRKLWEEHNKWQDFLAWKALSGQIDKDEIRKELSRLAWLGKKHSEEAKNKIKEARAKQITSKETKKKMSASRTGKKITWDLKNVTPEANLKRSQTLKGKTKPIIQCPYCKKTGGLPTMKQWHFDNCKRKIECL